MKNKYSKNRINTSLIALSLSAGTALAGPAATAMTTPAAEDWLKVSGYAAISYAYTGIDNHLGGDSSQDSFFDSGANNLDSIKLGLEATHGAFKGYASLFYVPQFDANAFNGGTDAGILDAYASYTTGSFTVTGGKYLSWMGYEAFDAVNLATLSFANNFVGAIPAYHTGIKFEYITDVIGAGVNVSDSIRQGSGFWAGDGDFSNGLGYEAYVVYKGIDKLTLWSGVAFDDTDGLSDTVTYDVWASYDLSDKMTIAGEIAYADFGANEGVQCLGFLKYAFTEQFSTVFRFGYDGIDSNGVDLDAYKFTVSPSYAFNEHLTLRSEFSFTDANGNTVDADIYFAGVQALLKF